MIHNNIEVNSGGYRLRKMTKTQVKVAIQDDGYFNGFLCGNRINPKHIASGWHLGSKIEVDNVEDFETRADEFKTGLTVYTPQLGDYPHYYQVIDEA